MCRKGIAKSMVRWHSCENVTQTRSSLHGYYNRDRLQCRYTGASSVGSSALCNKNYGISEDGETFLPIERIENDEILTDRCKRCEKIYESLPLEPLGV